MAEKNIRVDLILALAANWRAEGEYWEGTPADARSQRCADQLLKAFGLPADAHTKAGTNEEFSTLLKAHGIEANIEPTDRGIPDSKSIDFFEETAPGMIKELKEELESKKTDRDMDAIVLEKLGWAYEKGFNEGSAFGAKSAKTRYKRPSKKS